MFGVRNVISTPTAMWDPLVAIVLLRIRSTSSIRCVGGLGGWDVSAQWLCDTLLDLCDIHQVFREPGRGWGLRTLEDVKEGQLVFEYVGEVLDDDEVKVC